MLYFDVAKNTGIKEKAEPGYIRETRSILKRLFLGDKPRHAFKGDVIKLVRAKHSARSEGEGMNFEEVVLDIARICDEKARESSDRKLLDELGFILRYFEDYDHVHASLNRVALVDVKFTEKWLLGFLKSKKEFDRLEQGLFNELFIKSLLANRNITKYGKKKIKAIAEGLESAASRNVPLREVVSRIKKVVEEERFPFKNSFL